MINQLDLGDIHRTPQANATEHSLTYAHGPFIKILYKLAINNSQNFKLTL